MIVLVVIVIVIVVVVLVVVIVVIIVVVAVSLQQKKRSDGVRQAGVYDKVCQTIFSTHSSMSNIFPTMIPA